MSERYAKPGFIWQCQACGKTSETDAYGIEGRHDRGWDESCALNCVQVAATVCGCDGTPHVHSRANTEAKP